MKIFKYISAFILSIFILFTNSLAFVSYGAGLPALQGMSATKNSYIGPGVSVFKGAEITMLSGITKSQMMSYLITTKSGKLIVVDGGLDADADKLRQLIIQKGGIVSAWLITHPHSDHVGAITKMINDGLGEIQIEGVYYNFFDNDWYTRNEAYRAQMVFDCKKAFEKLSPSQKHSQVKGGDLIDLGDAKIHVLNSPYDFTFNSINNSSIVYRIDIDGRRVLFLGDLGEVAGDNLLKDVGKQELKSDLVQMAHHGQYGVSKEVYAAIDPSICLWNTPEWLWNNDNGDGIGSGNWLTLEVRGWMHDLGVRKNYVIKDGDQIIK